MQNVENEEKKTNYTIEHYQKNPKTQFLFYQKSIESASVVIHQDSESGLRIKI